MKNIATNNFLMTTNSIQNSNSTSSYRMNTLSRGKAGEKMSTVNLDGAKAKMSTVNLDGAKAKMSTVNLDGEEAKMNTVNLDGAEAKMSTVSLSRAARYQNQSTSLALSPFPAARKVTNLLTLMIMRIHIIEHYNY